jgi:hypothetical protein
MNRLQIAAGGAVALATVMIPRAARADLSELKWATEGYFRTRTVYVENLQRESPYQQPYPITGDLITVPEIHRTSYVMSRLRIMPTLSYAKLAKLQLQVDAFDDVIWGDNNGLSSAPLFATDSSSQGFLGGAPGDTVKIPRAWVEFQVPVGVMRVGRMASHWGMGLLANGGGSANLDAVSPSPIGEPPRRSSDYFMPDDWGDKHFGSTADRILFITKPLSIYKTITKAGDTTSNLIVGYAFDKLSEAPFLPYEPVSETFRPQGLQGFISKSRDDVDEHVGLIVWNNADWDQVRYTDELRVGVYGVLRHAQESSTNPSDIPTDPGETCGSFDDTPVPCVDTGANVYIIDLWWKVRYGPWYTEGEVYQIGGSTFGGVPYPLRNEKKEADINAGVARVGYFDPTDTWDAILEVGHASGDDDLNDEHFKQRAIHPDYNVGLILYEEVLRELYARTYGFPLAFIPETPNGATGFFSNGGVINSNYIYPRGHIRTPIRNIQATGSFLMSWMDTLPVGGLAPIYSCVGGGCAHGETASKFLGAELDLGLRAEFAGKMNFSLETGYLYMGDALKARLSNADYAFSLQTRVAFIW